MAEMPRLLFRLESPGAPALFLCVYLWGWVGVRAKLEGRGPHFVYRTIEELAVGCRNVGKRAVEEHLRQLREAGLVIPGWLRGERGFWLLTPSGCEDKNQAPDRTIDEQIALLESGDRRSNDRRSPADHVRERSEIADQTIGPADANDRRSPIVCAPSKEEQGEQGVKQRKHAAAAQPSRPEDRQQQQAAAGSDLQAEAPSLLTELAGPLAALGVGTGPLVALDPADPTAVSGLAQLLDVPRGTPAERLARRLHVRAQVLAFAAICCREVGQVRWWGPGMFSLVRRGTGKSWWENTELTIAKHRQLDAVAARSASEKSAARSAAEVLPTKPLSAADLVTMASSGGGFAAQCSTEMQRRAGVVRERDQARTETRGAEARLAAHRDQAATLADQRGADAGDDLERLAELGPAALQERRQQLSRKIAEALVVEDEDLARRLSQERLAVMQRLAATSSGPEARNA